MQFAVNARRQRNENPNASVFAETMKLLANSSYKYQFMDRVHYSVTKTYNHIINIYMIDKKTPAAIDK